MRRAHDRQRAPLARRREGRGGAPAGFATRVCVLLLLPRHQVPHRGGALPRRLCLPPAPLRPECTAPIACPATPGTRTFLAQPRRGTPRACHSHVWLPAAACLDKPPTAWQLWFHFFFCLSVLIAGSLWRSGVRCTACTPPWPRPGAPTLCLPPLCASENATAHARKCARCANHSTFLILLFLLLPLLLLPWPSLALPPSADDTRLHTALWAAWCLRRQTASRPRGCASMRFDNAGLPHTPAHACTRLHTPAHPHAHAACRTPHAARRTPHAARVVLLAGWHRRRGHRGLHQLGTRCLAPCTPWARGLGGGCLGLAGFAIVPSRTCRWRCLPFLHAGAPNAGTKFAPAFLTRASDTPRGFTSRGPGGASAGHRAPLC